MNAAGEEAWEKSKRAPQLAQDDCSGMQQVDATDRYTGIQAELASDTRRAGSYTLSTVLGLRPHARQLGGCTTNVRFFKGAAAGALCKYPTRAEGLQLKTRRDVSNHHPQPSLLEPEVRVPADLQDRPCWSSGSHPPHIRDRSSQWTEHTS